MLGCGVRVNDEVTLLEQLIVVLLLYAINEVQEHGASGEWLS